ncbi:uncharacterized protein [Drosophila tropicalis]|uniref:uncharacterized protein n=1 Tax=Drosophila tropicalis TaxID=46794 RepID=UPI0035AB8DE1
MLSTGQNLCKFINNLANGSPWHCPNRNAHYKGIYSTENTSKLRQYRAKWQQSEPNPEYHHAPRSYVRNYLKHLNEPTMDSPYSSGINQRPMSYRNPRYRWLDFRRRMVYGTYDI